MFFLLIESHGKSLLDSRYVHCTHIAKIWPLSLEDDDGGRLCGDCPSCDPSSSSTRGSAQCQPGPEVSRDSQHYCQLMQFCTLLHSSGVKMQILGYSFDVCKVLSWRIGEILNVFLAHIFLQNNDNIKSAIVWNDISSVRPLGSNDT